MPRSTAGGADAFVLNAAESGDDIITDFAPGEDVIQIDGLEGVSAEV